MNKHFNWFTTAVAVAGICAAGSAFATNGYFTHGTGTKNKAMAGSGIALPEDAIDVTNNPAVAPFVGDQLVLGAALFGPKRKYEHHRQPGLTVIVHHRAVLLPSARTASRATATCS